MKLLTKLGLSAALAFGLSMPAQAETELTMRLFPATWKRSARIGGETSAAT